MNNKILCKYCKNGYIHQQQINFYGAIPMCSNADCIQLFEDVLPGDVEDTMPLCDQKYSQYLDKIVGARRTEVNGNNSPSVSVGSSTDKEVEFLLNQDDCDPCTKLKSVQECSAIAESSIYEVGGKPEASSKTKFLEKLREHTELSPTLPKIDDYPECDFSTWFDEYDLHNAVAVPTPQKSSVTSFLESPHKKGKIVHSDASAFSQVFQRKSPDLFTSCALSPASCTASEDSGFNEEIIQVSKPCDSHCSMVTTTSTNSLPELRDYNLKSQPLASIPSLEDQLQQWGLEVEPKMSDAGNLVDQFSPHAFKHDIYSKDKDTGVKVDKQVDASSELRDSNLKNQPLASILSLEDQLQNWDLEVEPKMSDAGNLANQFSPPAFKHDICSKDKDTGVKLDKDTGVKVDKQVDASSELRDSNLKSQPLASILSLEDQLREWGLEVEPRPSDVGNVVDQFSPPVSEQDICSKDTDVAVKSDNPSKVEHQVDALSELRDYNLKGSERLSVPFLDAQLREWGFEVEPKLSDVGNLDEQFSPSAYKHDICSKDTDAAEQSDTAMEVGRHIDAPSIFDDETDNNVPDNSSIDSSSVSTLTAAPIDVHLRDDDLINGSYDTQSSAACFIRCNTIKSPYNDGRTNEVIFETPPTIVELDDIHSIEVEGETYIQLTSQTRGFTSAPVVDATPKQWTEVTPDPAGWLVVNDMATNSTEVKEDPAKWADVNQTSTGITEIKQTSAGITEIKQTSTEMAEVEQTSTEIAEVKDTSVVMTTDCKSLTSISQLKEMSIKISTKKSEKLGKPLNKNPKKRVTFKADLEDFITTNNFTPSPVQCPPPSSISESITETPPNVLFRDLYEDNCYEFFNSEIDKPPTLTQLLSNPDIISDDQSLPTENLFSDRDAMLELTGGQLYETLTHSPPTVESLVFDEQFVPTISIGSDDQISYIGPQRSLPVEPLCRRKRKRSEDVKTYKGKMPPRKRRATSVMIDVKRCSKASVTENFFNFNPHLYCHGSTFGNFS